MTDTGVSSVVLNASLVLRNVTNVVQEVEPTLLMSPAGFIAAAITLLFIGFFGFFLNLFVIILMWKDKQLWTPLNVILFNLVCSDFSVSVLGNPWTLISALSYGWVFGNLMCTIYGFFMSLLGITSITTLTVLAFERYIMVSQPFRNRNLSKRGAVYVNLGIWLYSLALTIPPLLGWGEYVNESANISCSVNWESQTLNAMTYIMYLFSFGLIVPLIVITFSYVNIIVTMKKHTFRVGRVSKAEAKVAYMVLVMIVAFIVAWAPYSVLALLVQFGDATLVTPAMGVFPALLAKSSICYNPIIYVGLNTQFRQSFKQVLGRRASLNSTGEIEALETQRYISQATQDSTTDELRRKVNKLLTPSHNKLLLNTEQTKSNMLQMKVRALVDSSTELKLQRINQNYLINNKDYMETTKIVETDVQV